MNANLKIRTLLRRHLRWYGEPSHQRATAALDRVWARLEPHAQTARRVRVDSLESDSRIPAAPWRFRMAVAAVLVAAGVAAAIVWRPADETLFRVVDGAVAAGNTVRSNGAGAVLSLADGSRVEMRSHSELSLEPADDGLQIRLIAGGIIVNAAKQRTGHLQVHTKDVTVSVVGTVFLVNSEAQGSRVAVIEGQVRVQQGANEKRLQPGEQLTSSPTMTAPPVRQVIAWSRNAAALEALLPQSAAAADAVAVQGAAAPHFEVASIRPRPASAGATGRSGSPFVSGLPAACGGGLQIDPRLFRATNMTLYELITIAYDKQCLFAEEAPQPEAGGLTGGPEWIRTVRYDIDATRPEDKSDFTSRAYGGGPGYQYTPGPKLRQMVQVMLAERFRLAVRRDMREMEVYELGLARGGLKLPPQQGSKGFTSYVGGAGLYEAVRNGINSKPEYNGLIVGAISATGASMTDLASQLSRLTGRPVLNRTDIEGMFTYEFFFAPAQWRAWRRNPNETRPHLMSPSLFSVLEEELGLTLEEATRPVEVLSIERIERPSDN
jgi:uncharacterized protein (TIGR03435 family)